MELNVDWATGELSGHEVRSSVKKLGEMRELFADRGRLERMDPETVVYRVQMWLPPNATPAGLLWGSTLISPGRVGSEYFMTFGHFHEVRERPEIYATIRGEGGLILMDQNRRTWMEPMKVGSVHYIRGGLAHRVVNTGNVPLAFIATCSTDAGHDYASILEVGFGARLREVEGRPVLVPEGSLAGVGD